MSLSVIVEKQLCAGAVARHVSSIGGHFYSDKRAWIRAGNDAGADSNQSDDFDATSLDTNRNPYPDLCHDHRFGGKRSANVDQRLCIWSLSVAGDLYSAYCYELYRRWPCRSLRGEKKALHFRHWMVLQLEWGQLAQCLFSAPCVKLLVMARCLMEPMRYWAIGPKSYVSKFSIPIPLSCWQCCRQCVYRPWTNAGR